jgi:hypothetical protein
LQQPEQKRPFEILRHRREDNVKMYLKEPVFKCGLNSTGSRYGPVVDFGELGNETSGSI